MIDAIIFGIKVNLFFQSYFARINFYLFHVTQGNQFRVSNSFFAC